MDAHIRKESLFQRQEVLEGNGYPSGLRPSIARSFGRNGLERPSQRYQRRVRSLTLLNAVGVRNAGNDPAALPSQAETRMLGYCTVV